MVSKVANFSIDLPSAQVAIQVSGSVRLAAGGGPASRPAAAAQSPTGVTARFYAVVARRDTVDAEFAAGRRIGNDRRASARASRYG